MHVAGLWEVLPMLIPNLLYRERQKPKMEVIMHKSAEFDEAVAQESAAGRHSSQANEPTRYLLCLPHKTRPCTACCGVSRTFCVVST